MTTKLPSTTDRTPTQYHDPVAMAAAAFLARYKTNSRRTYTVALRCYLNWCRLNGLDPLVAQRPHIELFSRMMEEQKYERTTHAKYISVVCLFYKFCLIDGRISVDPGVQVRRIPCGWVRRAMRWFAVPTDPMAPLPENHAYAVLCANGERHTVPFRSRVLMRELAAFLDSGGTNPNYPVAPTCGPHTTVHVRKVEGAWVDA